MKTLCHAIVLSLFSLSFCGEVLAHPMDDAIECSVQIEYRGQVYSAVENDDTQREARNEAIEEACEIACHDMDFCEHDCERNAQLKAISCLNRYTGEAV